jgi:hypothetical protein
MGNIYIFFDMGVPQIGCTECGKCSSIMGKSLCSIDNRGCCHYFPEFTLVDIQRMAVLEGGKKALDIILSNPGTVVNRFSIYSKGQFDKEAYDRYITSGELLDTGSIKDHTIFFRTCPYVIPGKGCSFPARFRTTVCNLFLCQEILDSVESREIYDELMRERSRYSRWVYRESGILQHILESMGLDLIRDFSASVNALADLDLSIYQFPLLDPITISQVSDDRKKAAP